jgi:hypothetical protein
LQLAAYTHHITELCMTTSPLQFNYRQQKTHKDSE